MQHERLSGSGCSTAFGELCRLLVSRGDGKAGNIHELVEFVNERKYSLHICKAWSVRDGLHKWVILEVHAVVGEYISFLSIHRFSEGDKYGMYSTLGHAVKSKFLREAVNPQTSIFFMTAARRLLMLDYILPGLSYMTRDTYHFQIDNCHHFAANLKLFVVSAGLYLETTTCVQWKPECEFALQQKQKHRPSCPSLSIWQQTQCYSWVVQNTLGLQVGKESVYVKNHQQLVNLVYEVVDSDYSENLKRTQICTSLRSSDVVPVLRTDC